jgi:hypothetical protein
LRTDCEWMCLALQTSTAQKALLVMRLWLCEWLTCRGVHMLTISTVVVTRYEAAIYSIATSCGWVDGDTAVGMEAGVGCGSFGRQPPAAQATCPQPVQPAAQPRPQLPSQLPHPPASPAPSCPDSCPIQQCAMLDTPAYKDRVRLWPCPCRARRQQ